jgi:hypothetical protein
MAQALSFVAKCSDVTAKCGNFCNQIKCGLTARCAEHPENKAMNHPINPQYPACTVREDISEYVAHLQLHMTLQARNLVPALTQTGDQREQLLQQTQADLEKQVSRQAIWDLVSH